MKSQLFFILTLLPQNTKADVNMKDASFRHSVFDLSILNRTYNSRSLHNGYFGFGWCTELEKSIKNLGSELVLSDCKLDGDITYKIVSQSKTSTIYQSNLKSDDKIEYQNGIYTRRFGFIQKYNMWGQLNVFSSGGGTVYLSFEESGRLDRGVLPGGRVLQFFWDPNGRITSVKLDSKVLNYAYENVNLSTVSQSHEILYKYNYDSLNNLVSIIHPDKTREQITYDFRKDWVTRVQNQCIENYSFKASAEQGLTRQTATQAQQCPNQGVLIAQYDYWFKDNTLTRARITKDSSTIDIQFDPTGSPSKISKKNFSVTSQFLGGTKWNSFLR